MDGARYEHVYSLKAEINTENTINKKVKVKLHTNGQNKNNTKNIQILQKNIVRVSEVSEFLLISHTEAVLPENIVQTESGEHVDDTNDDRRLPLPVDDVPTWLTMLLAIWWGVHCVHHV